MFVMLIVTFLIAAACVVLPFTDLRNAVFSAPLAFITALLFMLILPSVSYFAVTSRFAAFFYVVLLNIAAFCGFILYIGAYNAFVLLWIIPIVVTYIYTGRIAAMFSSALLVFETLCILFLYHDLLGRDFFIFCLLSAVVCAATIGLGFLLSRLIISVQDHNEKLYESKKTQELQLNRLNTLLNSISDTVLTLNRYGRITSQNSAALSFFDTNQTLVGKSVDSVLLTLDSKMEPTSVRKMAENIKTTLIREDLSLKDSNDEVIRLSVQISPIHGNFGDDENGCVVIVRDITRQKTLEDEKDEFISVTSHELRTPIAIAEGSLGNLMFMFEKGAAPDKIAASATMAHDQVLYLARMINDLSTLSRAERGVGDTPEEIDVNALLEELYLRYQPEAEAKSLKLNLDLDKLPNVTTSKLYLEEILQNFITNSIKYTKEGSVTLSGKMKDGEIICGVTDTGIGISKTDQEKVFDKFFRSEDFRTRETGGTGLGLYVVSKLASKLETHVEVKSRLNHGSTFSFVLPKKSKKLGTGKRSDT